MKGRDPWWTIDAGDGTAWLFRPERPGDPWVAFVHQTGQDGAIQVAWQRQRGHASQYVCATCGTSTSRDHCPHTRAAIAAYELATRAERTRAQANTTKEKNR